MSNRTIFADGFIVGWRSIMGLDVPIPDIPSDPPPIGTTAYLHGITEGIAAAQRRKAEQGKTST